jgi:hypothetical protein
MPQALMPVSDDLDPQLLEKVRNELKQVILETFTGNLNSFADDFTVLQCPREEAASRVLLAKDRVPKLVFLLTFISTSAWCLIAIFLRSRAEI